MSIPKSMVYILHQFSKKYGILLVVTFLSATITYCIESVLIPRILGNTFSHMEDLKSNLYKLVFSWLLTQIGILSMDYCNYKLEIELDKFLNHTVFHHLFIKYQQDHEYIKTANIIDSLTTLSSNLHSVLYRLVISIFPRVITICVIVVNIISIYPKIGYITAFMLLVYCITILLMFTKKDQFTHNMLQSKTDYLDKVSDVIDNIEWVSITKNAINTETRSCEQVHQKNEKDKWAKQKNMLSTQMYIYTCSVVLFSILLYYLYRIYKKGEINGEQVTSLLLSISPLFVNIYEILFYIPEVSQYVGIYHYYDSFINELISYHTLDKPEVLFDKSASIHISNVSFSYGDKKIYDHINLSIPTGSFITLRGLSGSGKSTLLKMIGAIMKPSSGQIMIDGYNINEVSLLSLYQHILYLHQRPTLFDHTVYYNISYGLDVKRDELLSLVDKYKLSSYLPKIDSNVGKNGDRISGGQRQLIHMIRCMFSPAQIFLLDESMSAMDENLTQLMITMLHDLHKQGKTILLISHHETIHSPTMIEFNNGVPTLTHLS